MATNTTTQGNTFLGTLVAGFDHAERPVAGRVAGISRNLNNSIMFIEVSQANGDTVTLWPERDDWSVC